MSISGSSEPWSDLLEQMLPDLLRLVLETWPELPGPWTHHREDDITEALCRALRKNRDIRELPFYVETQTVELDPAPGQNIGRLDVVFRPSGLKGPPNEAVYLCMECKRLNIVIDGEKRPGGSDYVMNGMLRFVNGQYARAVKNGGMLVLQRRIDSV